MDRRSIAHGGLDVLDVGERLVIGSLLLILSAWSLSHTHTHTHTLSLSLSRLSPGRHTLVMVPKGLSLEA